MARRWIPVACRGVAVPCVVALFLCHLQDYIKIGVVALGSLPWRLPLRFLVFVHMKTKHVACVLIAWR